MKKREKTRRESSNNHLPNLGTILMVEQALMGSENSLSVAELKRNLPRQVNHITLMRILEYLEKSNKVSFSLNGLSWTHQYRGKGFKQSKIKAEEAPAINPNHRSYIH